MTAMQRLAKKEAKARAKAIRDRAAPAREEKKRLDREHIKLTKAWTKKWKKTLEEAARDRQELQDICPHDFHYEMSFMQCQICGLSRNRSH